MKTGFLTVALLATGQTAFAQQVPTAGGQLQQIPPVQMAPKADPALTVEPRPAAADADPAGARIRVETLRVSGQTLFDEQTLIAASGFVPGRDMNLFELRAAAARIAGYYKARGYFLAQAYLPSQDVKSGAVSIAVIEGRYDAVAVNNQSRLHPGIAEGLLRGLDSGDVVANAPLERRLLLLSDIPGVVARGTLAPGTQVGTSDLTVDLAPGRSIDGSIEADNAGNRYTGAYRGGGSINFNNPAGIGDMLSLRVLASTSGLAYGRVSYQAPVGNLTVGAAFAYFRYDLGREFKRLDASGDAQIASLYTSYPIIRSRRANLYATGTFDAKWFDDRIDLVSTRSRKASQIGTIGLNGNTRDHFGGGALNIFSIGASLGNLTLRNPLERAADALTARSDGRFARIQGAFARIQSVAGPLSLYGAVRGQVAFDNLDTSEKMELGGAYGVRAYPEGEAYGDTGYIATGEVRLMVSDWVQSFPGQVQLFGFVDAGQVDYAHRPWFAGENTATRSGFGGGVAWMTPHNFTLKGSYARKIGDTEATSAPDRDGRFWFQVSKLF